MTTVHLCISCMIHVTSAGCWGSSFLSAFEKNFPFPHDTISLLFFFLIFVSVMQFSVLCHIVLRFCFDLSCVFSIHPFFLCILVLGLLFLLRGAVPSVPAARLHLLLRHLFIYWSGERQAAGGWHRVAMAAHLQHIHTLDDRFVTRCPCLTQYYCTCASQSSLQINI